MRGEMKSEKLGRKWSLWAGEVTGGVFLEGVLLGSGLSGLSVAE